VNGSTFPGGSTIDLTFRSAKGAVSSYPAATADTAGSFSTNLTIPPGTTSGTGVIKAKDELTGVAVSKEVEIT
jgi:hypothetical protein